MRKRIPDGPGNSSYESSMNFGAPKPKPGYANQESLPVVSMEPLPGQQQVAGSDNSTLRQMEAIVYDYTMRDMQVSDKMKKLKQNFCHAMKEDDKFVTQGMARDRRTTYHRGSVHAEKEIKMKESPTEATITEVYAEILQTFEVLFEREKVVQDRKAGIGFPNVSAAAVSSKTTNNRTSLLKNSLFSLEDIYKGDNRPPSISPACQVLRYYDREVRVFMFSLLQKHLIDYKGPNMIELAKAPFKVNKNMKKKF